MTTLRGLSLPLKVVFTFFLLTIGIGYLFAIFYLFLADIEPHAKMGMSLVKGVILKYYGNRGETKLEAAIRGRMGENISAAEQKAILDWIRSGATEEGYQKIQPIFQDHCVDCHRAASGIPIPPLTTFNEVQAYTSVDLGQSVKTLARVSHVHLFGMSFIFLLSGMIFALSELRLQWKVVLIGLPYASIWMDIGSWWFTKYQPVFAYTVIIGGALMGLALAAQIFISLYEMWIKAVRS